MATATSLNVHTATTACRRTGALAIVGTAFAAPAAGLIAGPWPGIHPQVPEGPGSPSRGETP
jgi:hypothetical protein